MEKHNDILEVVIVNGKPVLDVTSSIVEEINICSTYKLDGEYGVGLTSNTQHEFYFDLEDFDIIKGYIWYEYINPVTGYRSLRTTEKGTHKSLLMTSLLGCKFYDHIDRNPLNCRRNNLRPATQQQNVRNRSKMSNNTSGFTGVTWNKKDQVWEASICVNYKRIHLGRFHNKNDAIISRLKAEAQYFKDFAPQKHLFEQYGIDVEG